MLGAAILLGCLAMTGQASSSPRPCPGALAHWELAAAVPAHVPQMKNVLRVMDDGRLEWNGSDNVTKDNVRQYLEIITTMGPQPLMVLTYGAKAPCNEVTRARALIEEVLQCEAGECLEVPAS